MKFDSNNKVSFETLEKQGEILAYRDFLVKETGRHIKEASRCVTESLNLCVLQIPHLPWSDEGDYDKAWTQLHLSAWTRHWQDIESTFALIKKCEEKMWSGVSLGFERSIPTYVREGSSNSADPGQEPDKSPNSMD